MTLGEKNRPAMPGKPFNKPTDLARAPNGELYISDGYGNSSVHRFTADGTLIQSWGEPGTGPGQFNLPHGVWVDGDRVYVADRQNNRVQIFTQGRRLRRRVGATCSAHATSTSTTGAASTSPSSPTASASSTRGGRSSHA